MTRIRTQVSLYPLPDEAIAPKIGEALRSFEPCALDVEPDAISRLLVGDGNMIFRALHAAFCLAADQGNVVMVATRSNTC